MEGKSKDRQREIVCVCVQCLREMRQLAVEEEEEEEATIPGRHRSTCP